MGVGAAVGRGNENTEELKSMKHKEAINGPDGEAWKGETMNEYKHMIDNDAFEIMQKKEVLHNR